LRSLALAGQEVKVRRTCFDLPVVSAASFCRSFRTISCSRNATSALPRTRTLSRATPATFSATVTLLLCRASCLFSIRCCALLAGLRTQVHQYLDSGEMHDWLEHFDKAFWGIKSNTERQLC
jgi:hypothetical protein